MKTVVFAAIALLSVAVASPAQAQNRVEPAPPPTAEQVRIIESASWLAGRWVGEGLGGELEETWSTPASGQMVGHFRLVRGGVVAFYEICLLDVVEGGLRMRVKHFNPDFVGWEDRDGWHAFNPVSVSGDTLSFTGLTMRRIGDDALEVVLSIRYPDGIREETLRMRRAPL
ncbi:MAG TPA: DUF6265 family protein [Candidatus Binatia bacterium]|nr:DUF6265 family protein [Candidatus Binatia bacterium]